MHVSKFGARCPLWQPANTYTLDRASLLVLWLNLDIFNSRFESLHMQELIVT